MKNKTVNKYEILVSCDVSVLFTSIPVDKALKVIHERLVADTSLSKRYLSPLNDNEIARTLFKLYAFRL